MDSFVLPSPPTAYRLLPAAPHAPPPSIQRPPTALRVRHIPDRRAGRQRTLAPPTPRSRPSSFPSAENPAPAPTAESRSHPSSC